MTICQDEKIIRRCGGATQVVTSPNMLVNGWKVMRISQARLTRSFTCDARERTGTLATHFCKEGLIEVFRAGNNAWSNTVRFVKAGRYHCYHVYGSPSLRTLARIGRELLRDNIPF
jgi:hypothetical protein